MTNRHALEGLYLCRNGSSDSRWLLAGASPKMA